MKIGILGGTFNPLHNGHAKLAQVFLDRLGLNKLILLPACIPPHKQAPQLAGTRVRLEMCHELAKTDSRMQVSDYEIIHGGKNYTADTLEFFKALYPDDELYFLVGSDMFFKLHEWVDPPRIFKNAVICATYRYTDDDRSRMEDYANGVLGLSADRYVLEPCEPFSVSSTEIRRMVSAREDISGLVPAGVADIINKEELYRDR